MAPKHKSASSSSQPTSPAAVPPSANANSSKPSTAASSQSHTTSSTKSSTPTRSAFPSSKPTRSTSNTSQGWQDILQQMWERYDKDTPQRTRMIDAFMGFLVVVGALQFAYCCLVGTHPFNAFLAGFGATVGQFVLTASLRMQTNAANKASAGGGEFAQSDERAFADFVVGSLILHFFCVNFVN